MGAGYVSATSEVAVVSADRALALPSTRSRRGGNNVLKMLHLRRFCSTLACNIPPGAGDLKGQLQRYGAVRNGALPLDWDGKLIERFKADPQSRRIRAATAAKQAKGRMRMLRELLTIDLNRRPILLS